MGKGEGSYGACSPPIICAVYYWVAACLGVVGCDEALDPGLEVGGVSILLKVLLEAGDGGQA